MTLGLVALSLGSAAVVLVGPVRGEIVEAIGEWGRWAPAAFVVAYVVLSLLLVPTSVLTVMGGVLFGAVLGAALCLLAGLVSAVAGFLISRRLGRQRVERLAGDRMTRVDRWLKRHGLLTIAIARNVPGLPYGLLNYAAGVTGVSAPRFFAGTVLGILPGTLVYVAFGGSLDDVASPQFVLAAAGLVVMLLAGAVLERRANADE